MLAVGYATGLLIEAAAVMLPFSAVAVALTLRATATRGSTLGAVVDLFAGFSPTASHYIAFVAFVLIVTFMLLRGPRASPVWWIIIAIGLLLLSIPFGWPPTFR